jgi:hypothetical protein
MDLSRSPILPSYDTRYFYSARDYGESSQVAAGQPVSEPRTKLKSHTCLCSISRYLDYSS